jgi:hypothetical protein
MSEALLTTQPEIDIEAVLSQLDAPWDVLPEEALRTIQAHRELFIPHLVEAMRSAAARIRAGEKVEGSRHTHALMLLTEFKAREALPAVMEALSLSESDAYDLYNDWLSEVMPRTLALIAADQPDLIDAFVRDTSVASINRWEALGSIRYLVRDGVLPREDVERRLVALLNHAVEQDDYLIVEVIVMLLGEIGAVSSRELARKAFHGNRNQNITTWDHVERDLAAAERGSFPGLKRLEATEIDDAVEYLREYIDGIDAGPERRSALPNATDPLVVARYAAMVARLEEGADALEEEVGDVYERPAPIQASPKVGRNEPCPCGSGKKYKKCCGGR